MRPNEVKALGDAITANISRVVVGKEQAIRLVLAGLLAGGHVLLDDVPGTGKTALARALAKSLGCDFSRIQFTADMMPSDVTGLSIYDQKAGAFRFQPGPAFTNVLLADEINRTTPRTQSALLECMEERQITVDGETRPLAAPYFVIATENPVESSGTFELPEAQLDRFLLRLKLGYPSRSDSAAILRQRGLTSGEEDLEAVTSAEEILAAQSSLADVLVSDPVIEYMVDLAEASRRHDDVALGLSTRGLIALRQASRAWAALAGRDYVLPDDVKAMAVPVMAHRLILTNRYGSGDREEALVQTLLDRVQVPTEALV
jgi:MoxR-like ATPase